MVEKLEEEALDRAYSNECIENLVCQIKREAYVNDVENVLDW